MLNPKETLKSIKTLLGVEVALEAMKLENGTVLEADSFEAGKDVFIVTEDDKVALPVGDYTLEDGKVLVVSEEGIIGEIKDAEEAEESTEEPTEEVQEEEALEEEVEEVKEEYVTVSQLEEIIAGIRQEMADFVSPVQEEELSTEEVTEEVKEELSTETEEVVEEVEETPADVVAEEKTELHVHNPEKQQKNNNVKAPLNTRDAIYKILNK